MIWQLAPCSCSSPCLGPPLPYTQNVQIQSITDESRSSIRRKNPGQGTSLSRQSSLMDDTQEDEVAHVFYPPQTLTAPSHQACLYKAEALAIVNSELQILNIFKGVWWSIMMLWVCNYSSVKNQLACVFQKEPWVEICFNNIIIKFMLKDSSPVNLFKRTTFMH